MREDEIKSYRRSNIVKFLKEVCGPTCLPCVPPMPCDGDSMKIPSPMLQRRKRTEFLKAKHSEKRMLDLPVNKEQEAAEQNDEPGPGLQLGPRFDSDDNSHLYRALEPRPGEPGWLTR